MILAIRSDQAQAELYLLDAGAKQLAKKVWQADRELAKTLLHHIELLCEQANGKLSEITGIIVFSGEGSFTGLRIGATVANALAYSYQVPVATGKGSDWIAQGLEQLKTAKVGDYVVPKYDRAPNITKPKPA